MSRDRMSWDWIGEWPVFVYKRFLSEGRFSVKVVKGSKGDQNAGDTGPNDKAWFEYTSEGLWSKNAVDKDAFQRAAAKLGEVHECCY